MPNIIEIAVHSCQAAAQDNSLWVAVVSGASALLGAGIVALFSYLSAKHYVEQTSKLESRKLHASLVTSERLRWLQDVRGRLSEVYANLDMQFDFIRRPVAPDGQEARQRELDEMSRKVMIEVNNLVLMLNPQKQDQSDLKTALGNSLAIVRKTFESGAYEENFQRHREQKAKAFEALTSIGIETWTKIQNLE
jgi:hypothetical protein